MGRPDEHHAHRRQLRSSRALRRRSREAIRGDESSRSNSPIPPTMYGRYERFGGTGAVTRADFASATTKYPSSSIEAAAVSTPVASLVGMRCHSVPSTDARITCWGGVNPAWAIAGYTIDRSAVWPSVAGDPGVGPIDGPDAVTYDARIRYAL